MHANFRPLTAVTKPEAILDAKICQSLRRKHYELGGVAMQQAFDWFSLIRLCIFLVFVNG